jgi:hypothetical protein
MVTVWFCVFNVHCAERLAEPIKTIDRRPVAFRAQNRLVRCMVGKILLKLSGALKLDATRVAGNNFNS